MGRTLTAVDACAIVNEMVKEMNGVNGTITAVNTSNFASVGETLLAAGVENLSNTLSLVLGRTFSAVRPYDAKLLMLNRLSTGLFTDRMRKISYYSREAQESGAFNTDQNTNHAMGYDNGANGGASLPTMWEQNQPVPLELNFAGRSVWDDSTTIYELQWQQAMRSPEEFATFAEGIMVEKGNDIESQKEAFNRMALLNYMAGIYDMNSVMGSAKDMRALFNSRFGTSYTRTQLLTTYFKDFLEFFVETIKVDSDKLTHRSVNNHWSPAKVIDGVTYVLKRHTPKDRQRLIMYNPFWIASEARVLPEIFNDRYLKMENFEGVDFWQNENDSAAISITPAIPDISDPTQQIAGTAVALDYVLGVMFDEDAILVDYQLDEAYSTPVEARKRYRNLWWHFAKNIINDFTENGILYYMSSGE